MRQFRPRRFVSSFGRNSPTPACVEELVEFALAPLRARDLYGAGRGGGRFDSPPVFFSGGVEELGHRGVPPRWEVEGAAALVLLSSEGLVR